MCFYFDDLVSPSQSNNKHVTHLEKVFERLREQNIRKKSTKCQFLTKKVSLLGCVFTPEEVKPQESKIREIVKLKPPRNIKELRSLLGLTGFYRKIFLNYAKLTSYFFTAASQGHKIGMGRETILFKSFERRNL